MAAGWSSLSGNASPICVFLAFPTPNLTAVILSSTFFPVTLNENS